MNEDTKKTQVTEEENQQSGVRKKLRLRHKLMMAMMVALMMAASASATSDPTGVAAVLAQSSNATTLVGAAFDLITGNQLLALLCFFGLLGAAIRIFRKGKRAAR